MRTIVDIPEDHIKALDSIGKRDNLSRAEILRRAVDLYLEEERKKKSDAALDQYFGFLKDIPEAFDGLEGMEYQDKIRSEWDQRDKMYGKWSLSDRPQDAYRVSGSEDGKDR